jgi:NAD+ synthase
LEETGAEILVSIHGSPYRFDKHDIRMNVAVARVTETKLPLIYVNQVGGQDELVFDGDSFVLNGDCTLGCQFPRFEEHIDLVEFERQDESWRVVDSQVHSIDEGEVSNYTACVLGLRDYVNKNGFKGVVLGLSGGIDSALCAAMAVDALGAERVHCVMLPYHYTAQESLDDAALCAKNLGVAYETLPIADAVDAVSGILSPVMSDGVGGVTEENIQSRLRGVLLMALSNKTGDMLVTTGNKSEVSVGYATLYGDMNGGFNPIKDLYKTKVYALSRLRNEVLPEGCLGPSGVVIPENIITKAPTAELRENQTDQDSLPPYDRLDDILECLIEKELPVAEIVQTRGYDLEEVKRIEHLLYLAEYKRRQAAPGVKISSKNFGRGRRYPITNKYRD